MPGLQKASLANPALQEPLEQSARRLRKCGFFPPSPTAEARRTTPAPSCGRQFPLPKRANASPLAGLHVPEISCRQETAGVVSSPNGGQAAGLRLAQLRLPHPDETCGRTHPFEAVAAPMCRQSARRRKPPQGMAWTRLPGETRAGLFPKAPGTVARQKPLLCGNPSDGLKSRQRKGGKEPPSPGFS